MRGGVREGHEGILQAATELFAVHGYSAVSVNQVAQKASVCKANVFHHYISKEGLYLAVLRRAFERSARMLDELRDGNEGPLPVRLKRLAESHLNMLDSNPMHRELLLREILLGSTIQGRRMAQDLLAANMQRIIELLTDGETALRPQANLTLMALALFLNNAFISQSRTLFERFPDLHAVLHDRTAYCDAMADMLLRGIMWSNREDVPEAECRSTPS
jgi:TetR/AcrR family transcriptional regulator